MKVTSFGISFETQVLEFSNGQDFYNYVARCSGRDFRNMNEIPNVFYDNLLPIKYIVEY